MSELFDAGVIFEINRQVLHPLGWALAGDPARETLQVLEWSLDDEGTRYESRTEQMAGMYMQRHGAWLGRIKPEREAELGYVVQPMDDVCEVRTKE